MTARRVLANMPRPSRSDQWWSLSRKHQSLVTQMRTEHCPTNSYFNRLDHNRDSNCRHCSQASETVLHLLTSCPVLDIAGEGREAKESHVKTMLYGTAQQMKQVAQVLAKALGD